MVNFFKRTRNRSEEKKEEPQLTEEERKKEKDNIQRLKTAIKEVATDDPSKNTTCATLYEELGLSYSKLGNEEDAIGYLEKSMELKWTIGDGYKKLMSLYNVKRAEAARNGDDDGIEKYMNKMDEMRQIAKKVTISGK